MDNFRLGRHLTHATWSICPPPTGPTDATSHAHHDSSGGTRVEIDDEFEQKTTKLEGDAVEP